MGRDPNRSQRIHSSRKVRTGGVEPQVPGNRTIICNDPEANLLCRFKVWFLSYFVLFFNGCSCFFLSSGCSRKKINKIRVGNADGCVSKCAFYLCNFLVVRIVLYLNLLLFKKVFEILSVQCTSAVTLLV